MPQAQHHVYCVGAPKSGTHSIARIFASHWRAEHEPYWWELRTWYPNVHVGRTTRPSVRQFRQRRWFLDLDVESSHALGPLVPDLAAVHPHAKFILPYREPAAWLDSLIEDQLYGLSEPNYQGWWAVYDAYFGSRASLQWPRAEQPLRDAGLYPLSAMLGYWRHHHECIMSTVPHDQLLVLPTTSIQIAGPLMAGFVGVPTTSLDMQHGHSYARKHRQRLLSRINQEHVWSLIQAHASPTLARLNALVPCGLHADQTR